MNVLHLIDTLDGDDRARQLQLMVPALIRAGCDSGICCLGAASQQAKALSERGVAVHVLGWRRWLDGRPLWRLRELVRGSRFEIIHVWGLAALRALAVVASEALPRVVVSDPLPCARGLPWWDRRLLRRVRYLTLANDTERQRSMQLGLGALPWRALPYAATLDAQLAPPSWVVRYPRRIACAGRLVRGAGFREAIWAVDILRYVLPDVHLLIAGDGPYRADLQSMIDRLQIHNAHLLGDTIDPSEVLAAAHVCWVPTRIDRGVQTALDAMALGRAVVAAAVPSVRAVVRDGETGCLVPAGDPVALARETRALLTDPARCDQLGAAARAHVAGRFALPHVAARWHALYNDMAA